ncbi:MAG: hypothetical protein QM504_01075 [Pseudomonadota bacterium]
MLLSYSANLLSRLDEGEFGHPPDDDESIRVFDEYLSGEIPTDKDLSQILGRIKNSREVDTSLIPAMLASTPESEFINYEHFERIKAWSLLASIGLGLEGGHESAIDEGARRVRLILTPKYLWMMDEFPAFNENIYEIVEDLEGLREKYKDHEESRESTIGNVHCLLRDYLKHRVPKNDTGGEWFDDEAFNTLKPIEILPIAALEDNDYEYTELIERPLRKIVTVTDKELEGDQAIGSKFIKADKRDKSYKGNSVAMNAIQAQTLANRLSLREMLLPADWGTLTSYECSLALRECWDDACNNDIAALIIILMLLTGRSSQRVLRMFLRKGSTEGDKLISKNKHVALAYSLSLPRHHIPKYANELVIEPHSTLFLILPDELHNSIESRKNSYGDESSNKILSDIDIKIRNINRKYNGHITTARLSGSMFSRLQGKCDDLADAAFICGYQPQQYPALFYYAPKNTEILKIYKKVCTDLFEKSKINCHYPDNEIKNINFGTNLLVNEEYVGALFHEQASEIIRLRESMSCDPLTFHNEYVLYTYQLLCLGTGHRPVTIPFELRSDIDLFRKVIWISDKEVRSGLAARSLAMPGTICEQVVNFDEHLNQLKHELSYSHKNSAKKIKESQESDYPYLFWLEGNRSKPLKPAILEIKMRDRWPLPLNWHRHFMRNALKEEGLSGDEINAWMGHAKFGEESLGPWSGFSMQTMKKISNSVENIFKRLNIEDISGWIQRY